MGIQLLENNAGVVRLVNPVKERFDCGVLLDAKAYAVNHQPALIYNLAPFASEGGVIAGRTYVLNHRIRQLFKDITIRHSYCDLLDFAPGIIEVDRIPSAQGRQQALVDVRKPRGSYQEAPLRT